MLTKGQMEEAQAQCQSVSEGHIATLLTDPEAWKEYVASWELTRKYAVSQAAIDVSGPSTTVWPTLLVPLHHVTPILGKCFGKVFSLALCAVSFMQL